MLEVSKQSFGELAGVERVQILGLLADRDQLYGNPDLVGYGERYTAFGRSVELGQYDARHPRDLVEHPCLPESVLARCGVHGEQDLVRRPGELTPDHAPDLVQLGHQVDLGVQPPGRVDEQNVHTISFCRFDRVVRNSRRVRAALPRYNLRSSPLAPPLELLDGRRPKGIPGGEHRLARQEVDQLADRGRLPRAVHSDHEDHGGIVRDVELHRSLEHPRRVLYEQRPELLTAREVPLHSLLLELPHELGRGRNPNVGGDEDLLDPLPELLVLSVPKLRHSRVELPDDGLPALPQPAAKPPEPAASFLCLRRLRRGLGIRRFLDYTRFRERLLDLAGLGLLYRSLDDFGLPPLGQHLFSRRHLVPGGSTPVRVRALVRVAT